MSDTNENMEVSTELPVEGAPAAVVPPKPEEPAKPDFLAPKFVALSKKEKEIRTQSQALKAREAELQKKYAEYEERSKSEKSLLEKFKQNPLTALQELGITYDQLSEMVLNEGNPTTEMQLKRMRDEIEGKALSRVEQLEKQLADKEEREARERYENTINHFKSEIRKTVDGNEEKYELIKANEAYDLVMEVMQEFYNTNETIMDLNEAIEAVEAHLEEEASKILKLKKFQQTSSTPKQPETGKQVAPTLSNTLAAEVPQNGRHNLSEEEAFNEAARKIIFR